MVKHLFTITYESEIDENTGEILSTKIVSKSAVDEKKSATKKTSKKTEENPEPIVTLEPNKLCLTTGAVALLNVCDDCRIDVKYDRSGKPIIGTNTSFKTVGGNLLTKTNTVSFRGKANDKLREFGTTFKLEKSEQDGIFKMVGDAESDDIPEEIVDIDKELDSLDDIENLLDDDTQNFDFKL